MPKAAAGVKGLSKKAPPRPAGELRSFISLTNAETRPPTIAILSIPHMNILSFVQ
jgi:hypothetical protein